MIKKILTIIALAASSISFGQSISGGLNYSLFLCPDGTVKACGANYKGQLGTSNFTGKTLPESVSTLSEITAIAAGGHHSLFLKNDGTVWACGMNKAGQLGNGDTTSQSTPVKIDSLSGITAIAAGLDYSLFLKNNGTVWACGNNSAGQLGIGNTTTRESIPVQIDSLSGITAIAAGNYHSLFLKNDGTVWACGYNHNGQLGNGNTNFSRVTPVLVISDITAIAAGAQHSLFLKNDGKVWACGMNNSGQLGIGSNINQLTPVKINWLSGITTTIAAGSYHSLFLKDDGTIWACGRNNYGQFGDGTTYGLFAPMPVIGLSGITAIAAGTQHSLFLKNDGTIQTCGYNDYGQLGNGNTNKQTTPVTVNNLCGPPTPPTVDMSNMPTSVCLGNNLNVTPTISGSNPVFSMSVDNSINIPNPKAITKNKNSVFVVNDNDDIARFDFNGTLVSNYPNLSIAGIKAFAADDSSNVYLYNGDGNIYKCDSTGALVNTLSSLWLSSGYPANQLVFTQPVNPSLYPENLFLIDAQQSSGDVILGVNTYDNNNFSNSNTYPSDNLINSQATSMALDNFYAGKRALLADPVNNTLRTRVLYSDGSSTFDYQEDFLVPPSETAGMAFDFIDSDTTFNLFVVSSSTTGKLGMGSSFRNTDGTVTGYLDTSLTSIINPVQPVGIVSTKLGSQFQFWIADRGQGKILRAYPTMYSITPALPAGLKYNTITGEVSGTPTQVTSTQTYQVILITPYGADTTQFTFAVTSANGLSNTTGTGSSSAQQTDGLTIKYISGNNCEKLIDIADSLGGTSPGNTLVSQTVYPLVSVIASDSLIRRVTQITADNIDSLQINVTFYYTYDDIQLYKQTTGSTLSNDTVAGTMQIAVLQMHDLQGGGKEPIIHSPVTTNWSNTEHNWKAVVPVTKFSEFYAGDTTALSNFDCSNTGAETRIANDYYVWNYDTLYTSGDYIDTLINHTGCDSITTLHLTIDITTGMSDVAAASGIHVFPNPSSGIYNVIIERYSTPVTIKVVNVLGKEVYNKLYVPNVPLDFSSYQSGIYFMTIESNGQKVVRRIIKE